MTTASPRRLQSVVAAFVATAGDLPQVVLVQDNSHLNLTPASALPNRAHPFAAVIAIVISPASIGTIIHQDPLEIPEWGRQQDTSRCRKAGDPLWPSRKLHRPFSFSSHHQQA